MSNDPLHGRIRACLARAGLESVPEDPREALADHGFDSLLVVLTVAELEKEFKLRLPADSLAESTFDSIETLAAYISERGAAR